MEEPTRAVRFPNIIVNVKGLENRFQVVASICRAMARANVNPMTIANFSNIVSSAKTEEEFNKLCAGWVTLRKEQNGQITESAKNEKPDIPSIT